MRLAARSPKAALRRLIAKTAFAAALAVLGAAAMWVAMRREDSAGPDWISDVLGGGGFFAAACAAIYLAVTLPHVRGAARLLAGHGRIAQWQVGAAEWARFRGFDAGRSGSDTYHLLNTLRPPKRMPPEGLAIVVGEKGVILGRRYGDLGELRAVRWLANAGEPGGAPDCLEFQLKARAITGPSLVCYRLPVPAAARAEAARVQQHFAAAIRSSGGRRIGRPGLVLGAGIVLAAAGVLAVPGGQIVGPPGSDSEGLGGAITLLGMAGALAGILMTVFSVRALRATGRAPARVGAASEPDREALLEHARHGEAEAQFALALHHARRQDYGAAAQWFRKAAEQGFGPAQHNLAALYASGCGVPQDRALAMAWYEKAARQGSEEARRELEALRGR